MWELQVSDREQGATRRSGSMADAVEAKHGIVVRPIRKRDLQAEVDAVPRGLQLGLGAQLGLRRR